MVGVISCRDDAGIASFIEHREPRLVENNGKGRDLGARELRRECYERGGIHTAAREDAERHVADEPHTDGLREELSHALDVIVSRVITIINIIKGCGSRQAPVAMEAPRTLAHLHIVRGFEHEHAFYGGSRSGDGTKRQKRRERALGGLRRNEPARDDRR